MCIAWLGQSRAEANGIFLDNIVEKSQIVSHERTNFLSSFEDDVQSTAEWKFVLF